MIGLPLATKFSALPLLAPLAVACLIRAGRERRVIPIALKGALALLCIGVAFFAGQPYAFLDFAEYARDISEQSRMVRQAGLLPYTNQYIGVPKYGYDLEQLVLWGMAPPLGLVALWATAGRVVGAVRERSATDLVLLAWVVPFFLITGSFDVKFVRYLLPIYPIMILWASAWLWRVAQRPRPGRVALWTVVVAPRLSELYFLSIYTRPHTVVTAPSGLSAHPRRQDDPHPALGRGLPDALPGGGNPRQVHKVIDLPYYEPDTPAKWRQISQQLAGADYIASTPMRFLVLWTMAPEKYPISNKYFYMLFAGDLGYAPIYDYASRPSLLGIEFPDELADESFTVYDHPKVIIFENTGHLSGDDLYQKIMQGVPSRPLTRTDLLLARASDSGAAPAPAAPPIRSSLPALLWFALVVQLAGVSTYLVVRRWLPVPGVYALAKVLGVLVFAYVPWLLTSLGETGSTRATFAAMLVAMAAQVFAWRRGARRAEWWTTELFWGVLPSSSPSVPSTRKCSGARLPMDFV